jgi:hypothetical protein
MEKIIHRKILIGSVILAVLSVIPFIIDVRIDGIYAITLPAVLILFSIFSIVTSYSIKFQDRVWLTKSSRYATFLAPLFIPLTIFFQFSFGSSSLFLILILLTSILTILALLHLFIYSDSESLIGVIVFLVMIAFGIFLKKNRLMFGSITLTVFSLLMSIGSVIFGIRCLFFDRKNIYFRNVTFFGSIILAIAFVGQMFKLQHWPYQGLLLITGLIMLVLGSIYLLITLPSSGFIDWSKFHKRVLRRILIPWIFIFFLYISRFMVPELYKVIWSPDPFIKNPTFGFSMKDYTIERKNGLENE